MLSATFDDRGGAANYPAFSVDLTRSRAIFRDPEILYIICRTCCTSQGDPDSSFPCGHTTVFHKSSETMRGYQRRCVTELLILEIWYFFQTCIHDPGRKKYSLLRDKYFCEDSRIHYLHSKSMNMRSE